MYIIFNLRKIIFISSLDVYGNTGESISEATPCTPESLYGLSKLYCEKMIEASCIDRNITYHILRLGHVYGPGEESYRKVIPVMIENAIKGLPISIYGNRETKRSFIYVKDVAKMITSAISLPESCIVNLVGSEPITLYKLAKNIIMIYVTQVLQGVSYGLLTVSKASYANLVIDREDETTGQSVMTVTDALSTVLGSFLGGILVDHGGVSLMLWAGLVMALSGAVIATLAGRKG